MTMYTHYYVERGQCMVCFDYFWTTPDKLGGVSSNVICKCGESGFKDRVLFGQGTAEGISAAEFKQAVSDDIGLPYADVSASKWTPP